MGNDFANRQKQNSNHNHEDILVLKGGQWRDLEPVESNIDWVQADFFYN